MRTKKEAPTTPKIDIKLEVSVKKSRFFLSLDKDLKLRYLEILGQIYDDTDGELSFTEYENLVTLSFVCESFEENVISHGWDDVDPKLFSEYRRAKETIMKAMNANRESRLTDKNTIRESKEAMKMIRDTLGSLKGNHLELDDDDKSSAT